MSGPKSLLNMIMAWLCSFQEFAHMPCVESDVPDLEKVGETALRWRLAGAIRPLAASCLGAAAVLAVPNGAGLRRHRFARLRMPAGPRGTARGCAARLLDARALLYANWIITRRPTIAAARIGHAMWHS